MAGGAPMGIAGLTAVLAVASACVDVPRRLEPAGGDGGGGESVDFELVWARTMSSADDDYASDCVISNQGGHAVGSIGVKPVFEGALVELPDVEVMDGFVVAYEQGGSVSNVAHFGGPGIDAFNAVATDGANLYVGGVFRDSITIADETAIALGADGLVVRFDPDELTATWAALFLGAGSTSVFGLGLDAGRVFVSGRYGGSTAGSLDSDGCAPTVATEGDSDLFVTQLKPSGMCDTHYLLAGDRRGVDEGFATVADGDRVFVAGAADGAGLADSNLLVASLGATPWEVSPESSSAAAATDIVKVGDLVCAAGTFQDPTSFGGEPLDPEGDLDGFVTCRALDSGDEVWTRSFGGARLARLSSLAYDGEYLFASGSFQGELQIGDTLLQGLEEDGFIVALAPQTGDVVGVAHLPVLGSMKIRGMGARAGRLCVAGFFEGTLDFGDEVHPVSIGEDGFVAVLRARVAGP